MRAPVHLYALCSLQAFAQQHYTEGGVTRVVLLAVTPGKLDPFLGDLNEHLRPIWQEERQQGLITDYQVQLNTTKDSPEDGDVAIVLHYKNMGLMREITLK